MKISYKILLVALTLVFTSINCTTLVSAETKNYYSDCNDNTEYGWAEEPPINLFDSALSFSLVKSGNVDTWVLRSTNTYKYSNNRTMTLKSYTWTYNNETKICKGVTTHNAKLYGYVSAHFATIFGVMYPDSFSGRQYSYYGTEAVTPDTPDGNGWGGIAHTNCGLERED